MLEINLLPVREVRRRADLRQQLMQLVMGVILVLGAVVIVHSRLTDQIQMAQARVSQMEHDIEQFKPQLDQVAKFRKQKSELQKKIDIIEGLDRARSGPVRVLDELATRAPERLWLRRLETRGKEIELRGESLDNELVAHFLRALDGSPYFENVDLDSTELGAERGGLKIVEFVVRANLSDGPEASAEGGGAVGE